MICLPINDYSLLHQCVDGLVEGFFHVVFPKDYGTVFLGDAAAELPFVYAIYFLRFGLPVFVNLSMLYENGIETCVGDLEFRTGYGKKSVYFFAQQESKRLIFILQRDDLFTDAVQIVSCYR